MDQVISITVPLEGASGIKGKVDAAIHFKQGAGAMGTFEAFVKREREAGRLVELRSSADEKYPIAEVEGDSYTLVAFGPQFATDQQVERDLGEEATERRIAERIALDEGA
jgi:hypothetical protein